MGNKKKAKESSSSLGKTLMATKKTGQKYMKGEGPAGRGFVVVSFSPKSLITFIFP